MTAFGLSDDPSTASPDYEYERRTAGQLGTTDLAAVVELLRQGAAVDPQSAAEELPKAEAVVLVKRGSQIVGVGAIKRSRPWYAEWVQNKSKASFANNLPEVGYVAVAEHHRRRGLSKCIVAKLLVGFSTPLFATTDDPRMKQTLAHFGFAAKGQEWDGERGRLSLWLRSDMRTPKVGDA
jgi:hypothetical protein